MSYRRRGVKTRKIDRSEEQHAAAVIWLEPKPQQTTLLMCQRRIEEISADFADVLAELCAPYSPLEAHRWHRRAAEHREQAAILQARITLT